MAFELTAELFSELAKLPKKTRKEAFLRVGKLEYEKCADDVMYWLDASKHVKVPQWPDGLPYVFTKDPHILFKCKECGHEVYADRKLIHLEATHDLHPIGYRAILDHYEELSPIRPFTVMEYMPPIIEWWQKAQFMVVEKSRDMMATWLMVTLFTWDALFHNGRQHIFQSQDAGHTYELIQRSHTIYENHPHFLRLAIGPVGFSKANSKSGELLVYNQGSELLGFPQGPDQIRQFHPSGIFTDETAFQAEAAAGFAAIKPAIQMGGRYVGVSSANPSFFQRLVNDTSDE